MWDLERPLEGDCSLEFLKFDDEEGIKYYVCCGYNCDIVYNVTIGKQVFWHSSSHILGEAMERQYGGCLCYGPPIENGFYYDMFLEDQQVSSNDFPQLEALCKSIINDSQPFVRLEMKKEDLLEMFKVPST